MSKGIEIQDQTTYKLKQNFDKNKLEKNTTKKKKEEKHKYWKFINGFLDWSACRSGMVPLLCDQKMQTKGEYGGSLSFVVFYCWVYMCECKKDWVPHWKDVKSVSG
jgi:hypothetical protein